MTSSSLSSLIAALADEEPEFKDGARVLDVADPLGALLNEIDATLLSAELVFETEKGSLRLLATGRRLHKITEGAPDDVLNLPLSPDDKELTQRAAETLAAFVDGATELRVRHEAPPADASDMSDRVSSRILAAALGIIQDDPDAPPRDRFVARMEASMTAAIYLTDRVATQTTGSTVDVAALKIVLTTQLSAFLDKRSKTCMSHHDPSLTLLTDVNGSGSSLALAVFEKDAVLFGLATADLSKATIAFRQVV